MFEYKLEQYVRRRQQYLWKKILENYTIPPKLNTDVHRWIANGRFTEQCTIRRLNDR